jgi:parvulin-like peptidyl-prolyl isomerase
MRRTLAILSLLLVICRGTAAADRGVGVSLRWGDRELPLYTESHALIIGASAYGAGWPSLPGVKRDVALVKEALAKHGFTTRVVLDPTRLQFDEAVKGFIADHGQQLEARLLIYFAGHGHTLITGDGRQLGYVVPVDAPFPAAETGRFKRLAVSMTDIETIAIQIESKHVLFVFDSCFSGSIFDVTRAVPDVISEKTARPVRQFITAGSAEQTVPDNSLFRAQFLEGISGEADYNDDGYVTGTELGEFLQSKVTNYSRRAQTPEYGKLSRHGLDRGDFVFDVGRTRKPPVATAEVEYWHRIERSSERRNFEAYLRVFPNGTHAGDARRRIDALALPAPAVPTSKVIASGRGIELTQREFEAAMRTLPEQYQSYASGAGRRQFAADYVRMLLLARRGRAAGRDATEQSQKGLQLMTDNLVALEMLNRIEAQEERAVTDDALRAYYNAHRSEYEQVRARHILIAFKGSPAVQAGKRELTEEEARTKADRLRREIQGGADFASVARKESDDTGSGQKGGDLGIFSRGQMAPEFEKACFNASPGVIPPVVRTQFGYHVIRVESRDVQSFATLRPALTKIEKERRREQRVAAMVEQANVTVTNAELEAAVTTLPNEYKKQAQDAKGLQALRADFKRMKTLARAAYAAGLDREPGVILAARLMADNFIANEELAEIERGIVVSDADLRQYYRDHRADYETVTASHILIAFKGSPAQQSGKPELTEGEAKAKAERIRNELLGGASFTALAARESDDTGTAANGGDLGSSKRGEMVPEFEKAAFALTVGAISPVTRHKFGYSIIRLASRETTPFEEVRAQIDRTIRQKTLQTSLDVLVASADMHYDSVYFASAQ